jgi:hypothetical protein
MLHIYFKPNDMVLIDSFDPDLRCPAPAAAAPSQLPRTGGGAPGAAPVLVGVLRPGPPRHRRGAPPPRAATPALAEMLTASESIATPSPLAPKRLTSNTLLGSSVGVQGSASAAVPGTSGSAAPAIPAAPIVTMRQRLIDFATASPFVCAAQVGSGAAREINLKNRRPSSP